MIAIVCPSLDRWRALPSDPDATYDRVVEIDVGELAPQVSWGTNPGMVVPVDGVVPDPADFDDPVEREAAERALRACAEKGVGKAANERILQVGNREGVS